MLKTNLFGKPGGKRAHKNLRVDGDNIKMTIGKYGGSDRAGFIWLRIGTSDGLL
jgi:hypothetical protein